MNEIPPLAAVNIQFLATLVVWLTPTVVGSFLIAHAIRQKKKYKIC